MNPPLHPAPGRATADEEAPHTDAIAQVLRVLAILRRRWLVVVVTMVLAVASAALAVTMLRPRWRASASVVLNVSGPQVLDKVKAWPRTPTRVVGYKEYYQTQRTIIHSRAVAKLALAKLGLASDPVFLGIDGIESEAERVAVAATIDPIERLRELVSVEEVRNSRVLEISAEYPDADVARDIADRVAEAYLEYVKSSRSDVGTNAKDDIAAERSRAETAMNTAEVALQKFKDEHGIAAATLSDRQDVINQDIMLWSSRAKEAEADRIEKEKVLEQAKRLHAAGNLAGATLLHESRRALFETMRQQQLEAEAEYAKIDEVFGPKHEDHRKAKRRLDLAERKIEREAASLIESLEADVAAAAAIEHDLERKLGGENSRALKLGKLERQYKELERAAKKAEEDFLLIARRDTEIAVSNRVEDEGIEVLDWAVAPTVPVFPRKGLMFALALVAGLSLGSLLAVAVDFRDHRLRGLLDLRARAGRLRRAGAGPAAAAAARHPPGRGQRPRATTPARSLLAPVPAVADGRALPWHPHLAGVLPGPRCAAHHHGDVAELVRGQELDRDEPGAVVLPGQQARGAHRCRHAAAADPPGVPVAAREGGRGSVGLPLGSGRHRRHHPRRARGRPHRAQDRALRRLAGQSCGAARRADVPARARGAARPLRRRHRRHPAGAAGDRSADHLARGRRRHRGRAVRVDHARRAAAHPGAAGQERHQRAGCRAQRGRRSPGALRVQLRVLHLPRERGRGRAGVNRAALAPSRQGSARHG
ncbi:MAG: Wzz/FepE/Etk N-terminal domain-containing protein [Nannocystaceae bacterium]